MREIRLFTPQSLQPGSIIELDHNASRHASQVLRLKAGHAVTLFNGDGQDYQSKIARSGKTTQVEILQKTENSSESPLKITLVQGISRSDKMDFTLQKSVELGVACIQPVFCKRSILNLDEKRLQKKINHWQAVIQSACEQSGRSIVPVLEYPLSFADSLKENTESATSLVLAPGASYTLNTASEGSQYLRLLVGPEGGFDQTELNQSIECGFTPVSLGPRILRTETAGLAAIAILQAQHGDLC